MSSRTAAITLAVPASVALLRNKVGPPHYSMTTEGRIQGGRKRNSSSTVPAAPEKQTQGKETGQDSKREQTHWLSSSLVSSM